MLFERTARLLASGPLAENASDHRQADIDVITRGVGVGAHLMRLGDQRLGIRARQPRQRDLQRDVETETAFRARADADRRRYRCVGGYLRAALRRDEFHRADEAGGVAGREELL